jgi:hypothetical protein
MEPNRQRRYLGSIKGKEKKMLRIGVLIECKNGITETINIYHVFYFEGRSLRVGGGMIKTNEECML